MSYKKIQFNMNHGGEGELRIDGEEPREIDTTILIASKEGKAALLVVGTTKDLRDMLINVMYEDKEFQRIVADSLMVCSLLDATRG